MKRAPQVLFFFLVCLGTPARARAFSGAEGASFLDVPVGAGPAAMGGAYSAIASDAYAPVWNPAGLGFLRSTQLGAMHQPYLETTSFEFLSVVHPFTPGHALGLSAQYFRPGDMSATDQFGNFTGEQVGGYYGAYSLAYGQKVTEHLAVGLTGKWITAKIANVTATAYAGDAGVFYRPIRRLTLAAVAANVGTKLKFIEESDPLPMAYRAGAAYQATDDLKFAGEASYPKGGPVAFHAGIEWPSEDARGFCVRTGYSTDRPRELSALAGMTIGVGIPFWGQEVSYAWMPLGDFGHAHYFSLVMHFGEPKRQRVVLTTKEKQVLNGEGGSQYKMINDMLDDETPSGSLDPNAP